MRILLLVSFCLAVCATSYADARAIDFYVLEIATLKRLAADGGLDKLDHGSLTKVAKASGRMVGTSFSAQAAGVEIIARFKWTELPQSPVVYDISIRSRSEAITMGGTAIQAGAQYVTPDGHGHPYAVIVRFRDMQL